MIKNDGTIDTTNYIGKSSIDGLIKNDGTIDTTNYISLKPTAIESLDGTVSYKFYGGLGLSNFNGENI